MPEGAFLVTYGPYGLAIVFGWILRAVFEGWRNTRYARLAAYGPNGPHGDGGLPLPANLAPEKAGPKGNSRKKSASRSGRASSGRGRYERTAEVRERMMRSQRKRRRQERKLLREQVEQIARRA